MRSLQLQLMLKKFNNIIRLIGENEMIFTFIII